MVAVVVVALQHQRNLHDEVGLYDVPVVVRHTILHDIVGPLLEGSLVQAAFCR